MALTTVCRMFVSEHFEFYLQLTIASIPDSVVPLEGLRGLTSHMPLQLWLLLWPSPLPAACLSQNIPSSTFSSPLHQYSRLSCALRGSQRPNQPHATTTLVVIMALTTVSTLGWIPQISLHNLCNPIQHRSVLSYLSTEFNRYWSITTTIIIIVLLLSYVMKVKGAHGSLMVKALGFESRWGAFLNLPNPSSRTRPWFYSASSRNEYWKY
jgi:hypothetical protein